MTRISVAAAVLAAAFQILAALASATAHAEIAVRDDTGQIVRLAAPARRIVSLAPHVTENLYAAGAGAYVVGAVEYSDYPAAAKKLPRVGGYSRLDLEAIAALKPDLVVGWESGNAPAHLARLRALGLPVFLSQPQRIDDVAASIERLGELAGTSAAANAAAKAFRVRQAELRARYATRPPVRTFYQIWVEPLMTVNGEHLISDVMRLCGGENVFASLGQLAPTVTVEAVLAADPEAIVASGMGEARPEWLDNWKRWPRLQATARGNLFFIPPELVQRHTTRILDGADRLCTHLETARSHRPSATGPGGR
ncbi:MAG: cobalamin-binding protein [Rhodocyclaceae bacterium]